MELNKKIDIRPEEIVCRTVIQYSSQKDAKQAICAANKQADIIKTCCFYICSLLDALFGYRTIFLFRHGSSSNLIHKYTSSYKLTRTNTMRRNILMKSCKIYMIVLTWKMLCNYENNKIFEPHLKNCLPSMYLNIKLLFSLRYAYARCSSEIFAILIKPDATMQVKWRWQRLITEWIRYVA